VRTHVVRHNLLEDLLDGLDVGAPLLAQHLAAKLGVGQQGDDAAVHLCGHGKELQEDGDRVVSGIRGGTWPCTGVVLSN